MAFKIGADMPFFIGVKPALVTGKGEIIKRIKRGRVLWYVIICPDIKVSTRKAYGWFDREAALKGSKDYTRIIRNYIKRSKRVEKAGKILYNSFEKEIFKRLNKLKKIKELLLKCGGIAASLSGSGGAVFALFETKEKAIKCYKNARAKMRGSFICMVHSI